VGERDRISGDRKSLLAEDAVPLSVTTDGWLVEGRRQFGSSGGGEEGACEAWAPDTESVLAVGGRSSGTVDCLFAR